jgi:hypothetical protein
VRDKTESDKSDTEPEETPNRNPSILFPDAANEAVP